MKGSASIFRVSLGSVAIMLAASSGCSSSDGSTPSVVGNWIYVNDAATAGVGVTFKSDGTYVGSVLALTSESSADIELETGTYKTDGKTISWTPQQYSCPEADPPYTTSYSFNGGNLVLATSTGITSLKPNNATATDSYTAQIGCFDQKTKKFVPTPLAPVQN